MKNAAHSADRVPICYEVRGAGFPSLIFVHGWSCDRRYWIRQLDHFAQKYQVVAIDLAGHGESASGRQAWTMPAFGKDVAAVVEKLRPKKVVLIGHSMGGDVVVEAARRMRDRVVGLVWVDTYFRLGSPRTKNEVDAFMAPLRRDFVTGVRALARGMFLPHSEAKLVDWVVADMSAAPPDVALAAVEKAITFEPEILVGLRELEIPKAVINGKWRPTDIDCLERYGFEVVVMSDVGHFPMMEAPERFNRILSGLIEGFLEVQSA